MMEWWVLKLLFTLIFIMSLASSHVRKAEGSKPPVEIGHPWLARVRIPHLAIHFLRKKLTPTVFSKHSITTVVVNTSQVNVIY